MFEIFRKFPNLFVAFSKKGDGNLKLGDNPEETASENRERFFRKLDLNPKDIVVNGLIQEDIVQVVRAKDRGSVLLETDASITSEKGIFLSITAADCLPVFYFDSQKEVVAIAHAGWRGLAKDILLKVVQRMIDEFQSDPKDILVGIGPGIGECHYDVKEDVAAHFRDFPLAVINREEKIFLDLKKVAATQLQQAGVLAKNIEVSPLCTYCEKITYFSWRRDKTKIPKIQVMLALIGMRKQLKLG